MQFLNSCRCFRVQGYRWVAVTLCNHREKPPLTARLGRQITNRIVTAIPEAKEAKEAKAVMQFTHFWAG